MAVSVGMMEEIDGDGDRAEKGEMKESMLGLRLISDVDLCVEFRRAGVLGLAGEKNPALSRYCLKRVSIDSTLMIGLI